MEYGLQVGHDSVDPEIQNFYDMHFGTKAIPPQKNSWRFVCMFMLTEIETELKNKTGSRYFLLNRQYC
jgi:hypothetical protein